MNQDGSEIRDQFHTLYAPLASLKTNYMWQMYNVKLANIIQKTQLGVKTQWV
jgi:hypothetical protein